MPTLVNNLRAIRGPVTAVPMVGASGVVVEPDTQNNQVVVRADETVLYTGDGTDLSLTEDANNFERLRFKVDPGQSMKYIEVAPAGTITFGTFNGIGTAWVKFFRLSYDSTLHKFTVQRTKAIGVTFDNTNATWTASLDGDTAAIKEIVGINRIANN